MQKNRTQRKLPSGGPPVVTYSRRRDEAVPGVYDDGRAEPRFDDEPVAEWEAVEVPPEPPLHARRRARPLVEPVRAPVDDADFEDRAALKEKPKRSTAMRLVAVAAVAAIAIGIAIIAYTLSSSTTVTVSAPALNEGGAEPGTVPADDAAGAGATAVREIPLTGEGSAAVAAPPVPASTEATSTAPVAPPAPRARPEPPASTATAVAPDFDQATPLPPAQAAPAVPQTASAPADPAPDDDFIARIERTLAKNDGSSAPPLSPSLQPIQLAPQPDVFVPPENIPIVDGQGQPLTLPNDFLLLDTE